MIVHIKLALCRHTETDYNAQGIYTGHRDIPLNEVGRQQAKRLARMLDMYSFHTILSSDLQRAREVAKIIEKGRRGTWHKTLAETDPRLREVNIGDMDGLAKDIARVRFPEEQYNTRSPNYDFRPIGGESRDQVIERQIQVLSERTGQYGSDDPDLVPLLVVVGHGTSLRTLVEHLGHQPDLRQGYYQIVPFSAEAAERRGLLRHWK